MGDDAMMVAQRAKDQIDAHEKFCLAMTQAMRSDMLEMKNTISTFSKLAVGVMIAIVGWALVELYNGVAAPHYAPTTQLEQRR